MNSRGPIIIIEDDVDDQEMLAEVFAKLHYSNDLLFFIDGQEALIYLNKTDTSPFLILSDINLPRINGLELREQIRNNDKLNAKCIPYLFFTTCAEEKLVADAYKMAAQGFFKKPKSFKELENTIKLIMNYWSVCLTPNKK